MNNKRKIIILLIVSIALGLTTPFANVLLFLFLFLKLFLSIVLIASVVIIVTGLTGNRKILKWGFAGLLSVCLFSITSFGLETYIRSHRQETAKAIISDIEKFKFANGTYPTTIEQIKIKNSINGFNYYSYDSLKHFRIEYLMDGFDRQFYDSKNKVWGTLGWND